MLNIRLRIIAGELTGGLAEGEYSATEGTTVRELLAAVQASQNRHIPPENMEQLYPLMNGAPVRMDGALCESGTLHLCRVVFGG